MYHWQKQDAQGNRIQELLWQVCEIHISPTADRSSIMKNDMLSSIKCVCVCKSPIEITPTLLALEALKLLM